MINIVTVGRADGHTGDFVGRLIYTAQFNHKALADAGIPHRFTFVEWNSPQQLLGTVASRYVAEVPDSHAYIVGPQWHRHLCDNPNMVIMEFFAKNVAIRRSTDPVTLCTNADILFGSDTIAYLKGWKGVTTGVLYRVCHRYDVKSDHEYKSVSELDDKSIVIKDYPAVPPAYTQGAGDFQMALTSWWQLIRGYDETIRWAKIHKDHRMCVQTLALGGKVIGVASCYHLWHDSSYVNQKAFPRTAPWGPEYNPDAWIPYQNPATWGVGDGRLRRISAGVELLEPVRPLRVEVPPLPAGALYPVGKVPVQKPKVLPPVKNGRPEVMINARRGLGK